MYVGQHVCAYRFSVQEKHITHVIVAAFDEHITSNANIMVPQLSLLKLKKNNILQQSKTSQHANKQCTETNTTTIEKCLTRIVKHGFEQRRIHSDISRF